MTTPSLRTASELVEGYRNGKFSPVQATQEALDAIAARDGELNAYCLVDPDSAIASARASEERWRAGSPLSPIDGVPSSIKDMFLTKGWPTLRGSLCVDPTGPWDVDSPVMAAMRAAGLVVLGKVTTPELGWKATTDSPLTGITRNPWDPSRTAGGSSGGSAAAVAAGMGDISIGTDAGGSVRIPAAFCGVVGLKPTHGRISLFPASPFGALAHAGPFARSVEDIALVMDALSNPDPRDPTSLAPITGTFAEAVRRDVKGVRAAFSPNLGYVDVDPELADLAARAVRVAADAGLVVEEVDPGFADPADAFEVLWCCGAAKWLSTFPQGSREKVDPGLGEIWDKGMTYTALEYLAANEARAALGIHMGDFHTRYDVLITPTMPIRPFEAGHDVPPAGPYAKWWQWTRFSYPFNLTQQPAISIPIGFTSDDLPVGLQVVGPRHADDLVLAVARLIQDAVG